MYAYIECCDFTDCYDSDLTAARVVLRTGKNISRSNALLIEIIIEVLWDTCRCAKNKVEVL